MRITQNYMSLIPAYGRDYLSAKAAKADFLAGKDFVINDHRASGYGSVRDFAPGTKVNIRYRKLGMVTTLVVPVTDTTLEG